MNKKNILALIIVTLFIAGCSRNVKKEATGDVPIARDGAADAGVAAGQDNEAIERQRLEAERLEAERLRLEQMVNKIMAEDIYFEYDQSTLTEKARELLSQVGDIMRTESRFALQVEGHTDERGTESYNMSLGGKRAQAVYTYLTSYGVAGDRLTSMSFGEERPKSEGGTEDAHALNRRAAFKVLVR